MLNPNYAFNRMREVIEEYEDSPERRQAAVKIAEAEVLLAKCKPTQGARERDLCAPAPLPRRRLRGIDPLEETGAGLTVQPER